MSVSNKRFFKLLADMKFSSPIRNSITQAYDYIGLSTPLEGDTTMTLTNEIKQNRYVMFP